jgi:hypothetical protein
MSKSAPLDKESSNNNIVENSLYHSNDDDDDPFLLNWNYDEEDGHDKAEEA